MNVRQCWDKLVPKREYSHEDMETLGREIEVILTRMMNGDDDYRSMIPCYYTPGKKQEKKVA